MRIVYCVHSVYNPGGMERVLLNKVGWIRRERPDWEVTVVTTDQGGRTPFYPLPEGVRFVDLDVNYSEGNALSPLGKIRDYLSKRKVHRRRLEKLLQEIKADLVVTLYPSEASFVPDIKDGSRKVLEFHYSKNFRLQYARKGVLGAADRWRTRADERLMRKFDRFVVLTHEDAEDWAGFDNLRVIPNAAMRLSDRWSDCSAKRVIAVGRLDYQKGFDRLIDAWSLVMRKHPELRDWRLDIFGQGEWREMLERKIADAGLGANAAVNAPTSNIAGEYCGSSLLVMSSNYEGFPMVMIEGMGAGLPVVSFDFKCGPGDIIEDGVNGLLVGNGDVEGLAEAMAKVMTDGELRRRMGLEARKVTERFSEEAVMKMWMDLFEGLR